MSDIKYNYDKLQSMRELEQAESKLCECANKCLDTPETLRIDRFLKCAAIVQFFMILFLIGMFLRLLN